MIRKIETSPPKRTKKEAERHRTVREKYQRNKPSLTEVLESGEYDVVSQGDYLGLMSAIAALKRARQDRKLSLATVAKRSGIDKAALSRLENGLNPNPTFATLDTVARAIGVAIRIVVESTSANAR